MSTDKPLRTAIRKDGQPYFDEPIYVRPKRISLIEKSVAYAFKRPLPQPIKVGHERIELRWMKPDGKGGLVRR